MPHADSSLVPSSIHTKQEFWEHVYGQLQLMLDGQRDWVTNLANTSSVIFYSLMAFPKFFGSAEDKAVNWCGFYIHSQFFPKPALKVNGVKEDDPHRLLLGPFCGKPACQYVPIAPGKSRGVCADVFDKQTTALVPDVEAYPGHISCDGDTKSEIVCPLLLEIDGIVHPIGVLDLDCLALGGFDEDDRIGLERISRLIVSVCDW